MISSGIKVMAMRRYFYLVNGVLKQKHLCQCTFTWTWELKPHYSTQS